MKKSILFTSLALLSSVALAGCSCSKDGTYKFSHIEYAENGENKTSDCSNPTGTKEQEYCSLVSFGKLDQNTFTLDGKKLSMYVAFLDTTGEVFYKIKDETFLISETEDGEYKEELSMKFRDKTLLLIDDYYTVVYKK